MLYLTYYFSKTWNNSLPYTPTIWMPSQTGNCFVPNCSLIHYCLFSKCFITFYMQEKREKISEFQHHVNWERYLYFTLLNWIGCHLSVLLSLLLYQSVLDFYILGLVQYMLGSICVLFLWENTATLKK